MRFKKWWSVARERQVYQRSNIFVEFVLFLLHAYPNMSWHESKTRTKWIKLITKKYVRIK